MDPDEIEFGVLRVRDGEIVEVPLDELGLDDDEDEEFGNDESEEDEEFGNDEDEDDGEVAKNVEDGLLVNDEYIQNLTKLIRDCSESSEKEKNADKDKGKTRERGPEFLGLSTGFLNTVTNPKESKGAKTVVAAPKERKGVATPSLYDIGQKRKQGKPFERIEECFEPVIDSLLDFRMWHRVKNQRHYLDDRLGSASVYNRLKYDKLMARRKGEIDVKYWTHLMALEQEHSKHKYKEFSFLRYCLEENSPERVRAVIYKFFKCRYPSSWSNKEIIDSFLSYLACILRNAPEQVTFIADFGVAHTSSNCIEAGEVILFPYNASFDGRFFFELGESEEGFVIRETSLYAVENIPRNTVYWSRLFHKEKSLTNFS